MNLKQSFCSDNDKQTCKLNEKRHVTPKVLIVTQYCYQASLVAAWGSISYR